MRIGWSSTRRFFRLRNSRAGPRRRSPCDMSPRGFWPKPSLIAARSFIFGIRNWPRRRAASFPTLARMMRKRRILATAGLNRSIQAWHMAVFERRAFLLRTLVDERHWQPDEQRRLPHRVGYMDEGPLTGVFIETIKRLTAERGLDLEFLRLEGVEAEIIRGMQTCSVFLALNVGKSPLWGEGGPMTPHEALACGTVPICFDMNGPWELIQQDYNGVVLPEIKPELMARELVRLYTEARSSGIPARQRPRRVPHEPNHGITLACSPRISSFAGRIMRTLWLADHLLVSERGHHVSYNGFIADSARRAGLDVRILCARECDAEVPGGFRMHRIFRKDWRNNPSPLLSRSRLALDILEILAKRRFQSDLLQGNPTRQTSGAMTSSLRKCWRPGILPAGSAG